MSCTSRSEYRLALWLRRAATVELPVLSVGVWHSAQPTFANAVLPRPMESAPPGESGEGVGGARKRWKFAKFWIAVVPASALVASKFCASLGTVANWHDGVSSRSVWN